MDSRIDEEEEEANGSPSEAEGIPQVRSALDLTGAHLHDPTTLATPSGRMEGVVPRTAPSIILPNQYAQYVSHIALDIGGSLVKLVYFSPDDNGAQAQAGGSGASGSGAASSGTSPAVGNSSRGGKLHFVKFETSRVEDAVAFIEAKGLHRYHGRDGQQGIVRIMATGGGALRFADLFKERLGVVLDCIDEMSCLVSGCNFLLKAIHHEAFTYEKGVTSFIPTDIDSDLYPYLLVNIGSGVSVVKVEGDGQYERVSGSSLGGGTFWGLARLLTQRKDFDEVLQLSMQGDNSTVDMLVGDIYGGRDYSTIGLAASTIASSFGKVIGNDKELCDYDPADISMALARMISYNIGQLAYLNAMRYNIKRIFFGGFFIRGHPYTMETISYAIRFWSKGEMAAMFLRHEGFLGAVGAFLKVHPMPLPQPSGEEPPGKEPRKVRANFVERFSMGAPFVGGEVVGPPISDLNEKVSWVEKFVQAGAPALRAVRMEHAAAQLGRAELGGGGGDGGPGTPQSARAELGSGDGGPGEHSGRSFEGGEAGEGSDSALPFAKLSSDGSGQHQYEGGGALDDVTGTGSSEATTPMGGGCNPAVRMSLHVGVLHYSPSLEPFPLLADPASYEPNTLDISLDKDGSFGWWLKLLDDQVPTVVEKAIASEGGGELATRRAMAFGRSLSAHLHKLAGEPGAYGRLGLAELFEMREECLREFGFNDVYRLDKERENTAALSVLPDLLVELDAMPPAERLLCLIEGCLASNIFDWGAKECVKLYQDGTILDIYRTARQNLGKRPWAIDHFDALAGRLLPGGVRAAGGAGAAGGGGEGAAAAAGSAGVGAPPGAPGGGDGAVVPPAVPGGGGTVMGVAPPPYRRVMMFVDNAGADIVLGMLPLARELLRQGSEVVLVANSQPAINDITAPELRALLSAAARHCSILRTARAAGVKVENAFGGRVPAHPAAAAAGRHSWTSATTSSSNTATCGSNNATTGSNNAHPPAAAVAAAAAAEPARAAPTQAGPSAGPGPGAAAAEAAPAPAAGPSTSGGGGGGSSSGPAGSQQGVHRHAPSWGAYDPRGGGSASASGGAYPPGAKLFVVASGAGGPCMDFRRVPDVLAEACVGTDLLIIEGMGRAIHTNLYTRFRCDTLKLAMIKTEWLAKRLFGGSLYDCVCVFEEGIPDGPGAARPRTSEA